MAEQTVETPTEVIQTPPVSEAQIADPFALEENSLASLSPEQRASLDPILDGWKKRATEEITKRESSISEKYKPLEEKATALEKLIQYQPFVQWWQGHQNQGKQVQPQQIASQQEWQEAIYEASQGDGTKMQALQTKLMSTWAAPLVTELKNEQQKIQTKIQMDNLFTNHPDAKDLDKIGLDPKTKQGTSLLETAFDWAERNGKTLEDGYNLAKKWADSFHIEAQQKAMGMVQEKKQGTTQGPSTSTNSVNVVEVANGDEMIRKSLEAQLDGNKDVRFVIKK